MEQASSSSAPSRQPFAVCVVGWYFGEAFYRALGQIQGAELYLVSHKPAAAIPPHARATFAPERVLVRPNVGYDWGAYQQFLEAAPWRRHDCVVFIQDDVEIKDAGFPKRLEELFKIHAVVGNGCQGKDGRSSPRTQPQSYAFARWKPPTPGFEHDNVRGSFFAVRRDALERMGAFEVFWDPLRLTSGYGNWSTRASCAKLQFLLGPDCFGYLSPTYRESAFVAEMERGGAGLRPVLGWKAYWNERVRRWSIQAMSLHWRVGGSARDRARAWLLGRLVGFFASRWPWLGRG